MPTSVVAAVAASAVGEAVAGAIMFGTVMSSAAAWTFAFAAIEMGTTMLVSSVLNNALSGGPDQNSSQGFSAQAMQRTHVVRSPVANRAVIYGQAMVSGPLVFAATTNDDNVLHMVIALAGHEVEEIGDIYFNDDLVDLTPPAETIKNATESLTVTVPENSSIATYSVRNYEKFHQHVSISYTGGGALTDVSPAQPSGAGQYSRSGGTYFFSFLDAGAAISIAYQYKEVAKPNSKYYNFVEINKHLGAATQAADADLVAANVKWTSAHRLCGVAYIYVKLTYDREVFPRGIPNIKAVVKGKKVYDPRTGLTAWSSNWALCVRDYLASSYGLGCGAAELDDATFIASANISDEPVAKANSTTEPRYTCNGVVDLGSNPRQIMESMLSAGGGVLTWTAGVYHLWAAAYTSPTITLDEDDLRGPIRVRPRLRRQNLFNAVRGTYVDPEKYWQPGDFPPVSNATYAAQDGGQVIWKDLALPMTTSAATAQRLAKIQMERSRQGATVEFPAKLTAFKVAVWDTVRLNIAQLGYVGKEFKVVEWEFDPAGGVNLLLQEEAAGSYDWNSGLETTIDLAPDTVLPDPSDVLPPGVPMVSESLYSTTGSAGVKARATVTWDSQDPYAISQRLAYRRLGGYWVTLPDVQQPSVFLDDLAPGHYEFRAATLNAFGVVSDWSGVCSVEFRGLTEAPASPTGFYVVASDGGYEAEWVLTSDLDVKIGGRAVIRHSTLVTGATWNDGIVVKEVAGSSVGARVPLMAGTYMLKFQDSSGNWCDSAAIFVPSEAMLTGYTTVATSTQHAAFSGAKSNVAVVGGALRLDSSLTISEMTTPISAWPRISSLGGISGSGSYTFDAVMDLTTVAARRFDATITANSFETGDLIGFRGLVSEWDSVAGVAVNDCDATLYIRTTDDDPAATPSWGAWTPFFVGEFSCRAAQFRVDLSSGSPTHNIALSALSVRARVPA